MTDLERAAEEWSDTHRSVRFGQIAAFIAGAKWAFGYSADIVHSKRMQTLIVNEHAVIHNMNKFNEAEREIRALAGEEEKNEKI